MNDTGPSFSWIPNQGKKKFEFKSNVMTSRDACRAKLYVDLVPVFSDAFSRKIMIMSVVTQTFLLSINKHARKR